ncbi:MAG: ATP synthase F1 subunit epsilon [Jaaginema sp. PMC 1079.18]|nr:ATP synthase F1 subunit epsilon [Jaaginema sp. PMC 1080.18]MEC4852472.1 ATP synthase F1 subunit epsilon [Jaaginema sp. PMC 1079.18]MEC4864758.1 ATP synthase F1 subunit epsilon [Jaaginema sp. PMC 1078.18]
MSLSVRVIAPDKTVWDGSAEEVILPSITGQIGILSGHAPLLTALDTGVMRVRTNKSWVPVALFGGFAEVEEDQVTILVNGAQKGEDINAEAAKSKYEAAQKQVEAVRGSDNAGEKMQAEQALKKARARFQAANSTAKV